MLKTLYKLPTESARHEQLKILFEQYFINTQKLMDRPSQLYACRARQALIKIRKVAFARGKELLSLYSPFQNKGRQAITIPQKQKHDKHKHRIVTADKQDAGRQDQETSTTDAK